jgi:hypothetical protein
MINQQNIRGFNKQTDQIADAPKTNINKSGCYHEKIGINMI